MWKAQWVGDDRKQGKDNWKLILMSHIHKPNKNVVHRGKQVTEKSTKFAAEFI